MDSYEFNKIAGAVLGALFVVLGLNIVANALISSHPPAVQGFNLPAIEEAAVGGGAAAAPAEPIAVRLAKADEKKGQAEARACVACHIFTPSGDKKPGPPLFGIVNRPVASQQFGYTAAMKEEASKNPAWTYEHLDKFLAAPKSVVKGTAMNFAGISNPNRRADVILYLRSLSETPPELPAAQ